MTKQSEQFGTDKYTVRIVLEILLLGAGLAVMAWFSINTTLWQTAQIFWILGLTAGFFFLAAFLIPKSSKINFNIPIAGQSMLPIPKKILYWVFTVVGLVTFFIASKSSYRVAAPAFQLIDVGIEGDIALKTFAAIIEDNFFFVSLAGLIFALVLWRSKNFWLSLGTVLLLVPPIFMGYHGAVYGFDSAESWAVLLFGSEMTIAMIVLRDVTYVHARHIANNLGILVFESMDMQTFMITLTSSWVFWVIVAAIVVFLMFRLIRHKKK